MRKPLPGVVGPDGACVGGEPLGAVLGCLPLAIALDLADLNVPLLGGLPGKGGHGDGGVRGASNLNVHWKQKKDKENLRSCTQTKVCTGSKIVKKKIWLLTVVASEGSRQRWWFNS